MASRSMIRNDIHNWYNGDNYIRNAVKHYICIAVNNVEYVDNAVHVAKLVYNQWHGNKASKASIR